MNQNSVINLYPLPPALTIVWYPTFEDVEKAMWGPVAEAEGISYEELLEADNCGQDARGNEVVYSRESMVAGMTQTGCWAFADTNTNTVHAWAEATANPGLVLHMLAHEVAHLTGTAAPDGYQEEMRAEQFGSVAAKAFDLIASWPLGDYQDVPDVASLSNEELQAELVMWRSLAAMHAARATLEQALRRRDRDRAEAAKGEQP